MTGTVSYALVRELRAQVAQRMTSARSVRAQSGQGTLAAAEERQLALAVIADAVRDLTAAHVAEGRGVPDGVSGGELAWAVEAAMFGAGPLQPLLEDEDLENLDLNGYDEVWATYASRGRVRLPAVGDSDQDLIDILRALASYAGPVARPWSTVHPQLDLGLPGGVRVSGLLAASARPQVSIRRDRLGPQAFLDEPPRRYPEAISLVELGTMDRQCAAFLAAVVRARANVLIAGATDAGKTTLLRAMANAIPAGERIITIEQARELRLGREASLHADVVELETVLPSSDDKGGLDGADLVRRSKRMNPDRLIFGEVLAGGEARAMLEAMLQGGDGSMSTIHARNAYGAIARLIIGLGSLREPIQPSTAAALIGQAIDFVVYVRHGAGSRRVVTEILEISGHQGESVSYATIFASPDPGASASGPTGWTMSGGVPAPDASASSSQDYGPARRDPRIPLRRAALLARHGYTDELGERLNAEGTRSERRRHRQAVGRSNTGPARRPGESERERPWADLTPSAPTINTPPLGQFETPGSPIAPPRAADLDFGQPSSHIDPAGIPGSLLQYPRSEPDSLGLGPDENPVDLVRSSLDLPDDGRGGGEPIAHRRKSEPLAPAPVARESVTVDPGQDHDAQPDVAGLNGLDGRTAGPIIDLGARRRNAAPASASAGPLTPTFLPALVEHDQNHQYEGTLVVADSGDGAAAQESWGDEDVPGIAEAPAQAPAPATRRSRRARSSRPAQASSTASERTEVGTGESTSGLGFPLERGGAGDQVTPAQASEPEWKRLGLPRSPG